MLENQNAARKVASQFTLWIMTDIQIHQAANTSDSAVSFFQRICIHKLQSWTNKISDLKKQ